MSWWFRRRRAGVRLIPDITDVVPPSWAWGSPTPITVSLQGLDFHSSNAALRWNGVTPPPTFKSATEYRFSADAVMLGASPRIRIITLTNPNGRQSSKDFEIVRPVITSISPTSVAVNDSEYIDVYGIGLTSSSQIYVNVVPMPTVYLDNGHVRSTDQITFSVAGTVTITIQDRGAVSNGSPITVS